MNNSLRFWLTSGSAAAIFLALLLWGFLSWNLSNYSQLVADRLLLLAELRRGAVQEYFSTAEAELRFWSIGSEIIETQATLLDLWHSEEVAAQVRNAYVEDNPSPPGFFLNLNDAEDGSAYSALHARLHPRAKLFVTQRGYYDFFLISPAGDVMYSVEKEQDFGTNLASGPWRDTGLARVFSRARKMRGNNAVVFGDMEPYAPSNDEPAMFMATALHSPEGLFLGVIAFQLPIDRIQAIMNYTSGMGRTGETYLVGSDKLMRSDSRFSQESTVLKQEVDTPGAERALAGEQGMAFIEDYRGTDVMSVYVPIALDETTWAVMAEIDQAEIEEGAARDRPALAVPLAFFYGLSLWSLWYWQNRQLPADGQLSSGLDFSDRGDGGGGMDG